MLAIIACWLNALPLVYQAILTCIVVVFWTLNLRHGGAYAAQLRYTPPNRWEIDAGHGCDAVEASILNSTTISDWAIFLHFKTNEYSRQSLLIIKDSLTADSFRCLKVRLKLSECRR